MKKYILILSVFVFVLFGFNFNIAKADTTPAPDCVITSTLRIGSTGDEVACLQLHLGLTADGKFGRKTKQAVIDLQARRKLTVDGILGPKSRVELENDSSNTDQNPSTANPISTGTTTTPTSTETTTTPVSTATIPAPVNGCISDLGFSPLTGEPCGIDHVPFLSLSPTSLSFSAIQGGSNPANQQFKINNLPVNSISGLSMRPSENWISLPSGPVGTPSNVFYVAANSAGFSRGVYTGQIVISGNFVNSPIFLPVTLNVTSADGCTSNSGFSVTTGAPCSATQTPTNIVCEYAHPPVGYHYEGMQPYPICGGHLVKDDSLVCTSGFDATTGLRCGCTSNSGYSTITGLSCEINPALTITTTSPLPNAKVGNSYNTTVSVTGGIGAYTWGNSSGSLPSGLSYSYQSQSGQLLISGTPVKGGTYAFSMTVSDGSNFATKQFTLIVDSTKIETPTPICPISGFDSTTGLRCGCTSNSGYSTTTGLSCSISSTFSIYVLTPNPGETWKWGTTKTITWQGSMSSSTSYDIKLISYCRAGAVGCVAPNPYMIANVTGSSYDWLVGKTLNNDVVSSGQYSIQVCQAGTTNCNASGLTIGN